MINCTHFDSKFSFPIDQANGIPSCLLTKAREIGKTVRHSSGCKVKDTYLQDIFKTLTSLLEDPKCLAQDVAAQEAVSKLAKLQTDSWKITPEDMSHFYEQSCEDLRERLMKYYNSTSSNVPLSSLDQSLDKRITDIYATPKIHRIDIKKDGKHSKAESVFSYKEIFNNNDTSNRRIYVQGEPGSGKSTFAAKLVHDWSNGNQPSASSPSDNKAFDDVSTIRKFKFVFFITFRDSSGQTDVTQMIKKQLIDTTYSEEKRDFLYKLFIQIIETEPCLVVRDGLDEWVAPEGCNLAEPSMAGFPNDKCTVLTTSRPWKLVDERIKNSQIDSLLEIEGINDPETFIETILQCIIDETKDLEETLTEFQTFVREYHLEFLSYSPMLYTLVICTWVDRKQEEGHTQGSSLCALYTTLLESLCKKANNTIGFFNESNIAPLNGFSDTNYLQPNMQNVDAISKAAFELLFSKETETSIVFNDKILSNYVAISVKEFSLKAGLISKRKTKKSSNAPISFIHKSMQEFLAAFHIVRNTHLIDGVISGHLSRCKNVYRDIGQVFIFLCGLDISAASKLSVILDARTLANGLQSSFDPEFDDDNDSEFTWYSDTTFQELILAGYREAVANGHVDIRLKLSHFCIRKNYEIRKFRELQILWTNNKSNALSLTVCEKMDTYYSDGEISSTSDESSSESGESHIEFDLASCQQLKSLKLNGNGIWMTDSSSLATSEFLVWIVLNSTDQAQCTVPSPVLPSIKYILLKEVTCSSTMVYSLFSTLIARGHDMQCKATGCKIRSCSEREVSKLNITVDVTIVTDLNDTFSLFNIQGTGPGLWEAFHGFNINYLNLSVSDDETIGDQDVLFSQLLSSQTQLETLYMDVSKESLGLCKAFNGLNIKILHLAVLKDDVIINHIESFSETLTSLTQLEQLYILVHNDNAALWKAIHGLNITILSLAGVVKGFTVIHVESLSETLTSLKQLKQLSIEFYDDSPGLWKAFHGLNINRLSLVCLGKGFTVIHAKHLSETLSSLKQLEEVSIEVDNDSPGLWEALYGLNIKSLSLSNIESITSKLVESLTQKFHQHLQYLNLVVIINQRSLLEALGHLSVLRSWDRVRRSFASEYLTVKYVECLSKTLTSLKQLEQLSIIVDDGSPALWDALYGLNIKRLGLGIARIRMPLNQSLSKTLTSLRQLEHLSIIANEDGPALWDALYGLNVNSLILSGEEKNLIHIESLSESLTSFTQLKYLSILVIDDSPGLWTALNGLNIKSLELSFYRNDFIVKHGEFLSKTLTSFAQLEELLIEVYDDSPGLWEALYGMNIKSLSLTCVGKSNIVSDVESMSETLTSLTQLEILRIEVDDDSPGLWEALNGMTIKSLSLKGVKKGLTVNHAQSLSETLTSLTQLENISVTLDNESSGLLEALYGLTIERLGLIWVGKVFISSNEESLSETLISLTRLENLSIEVDDDCPGLWKALYGLNIKNLRLRSERKGLTVSNVESLSESLKSLKQLDKITIEMKSDSPGLWEALYGLNTKRLCLSGCSGGLEVNHAEEMSQSLASLTHLESLSIDFNKDSICLWEALKDLTIKRLRLCYISGGSQVIHAEALSQSLSSLKHLDMLGIGLNVENPGLWEALHGLNINSLCLNLRFCLTGLEVQNMSQFLSSLTHLETLRIEAKCDSPDLWEAFRGLQIKNLHIGTELGCFEVDHVSSLVMSLSSLNQLEHISINLENDLPGLWEVLFGLQIKSMKMYMNLNIEDLQPTTPNAICINMEYYTSGVVEAPYSLNVKSLSLRLIGGWENLKVYQTSRLTQMLSSLTALEMLSITADMDSVALWESLHALNVKNLSLSGRHGGLKVNYAALLSQSLSSITQLETFNITVDDDIPGLLEALRGLKIKRLKLILGHESSLSKSLASLTQLERLTMRMKLYSDIHLTQSLQYLEFYYERLSPRELRELLNKVFELNHKVQCRLEFGCSRIIEEYLTIKQELDAQAHVEVDWFRAHARTRDTNTNNVEYNISMGLLINRVKDPASTTSICDSVRFSSTEYELSTFPASETAYETVRMIAEKFESVDVTLHVQERELMKENRIQIYEVFSASSNRNTDTFSINEIVERISRFNKPALIIGTIEKRKSILDYCRTLPECVFYLLLIDDNGPSDDAEIPSNVKVAYSTTEHKMAVADDLLERFALRILRHLTERLLNTKHANDVDDMIEIIRCAFKQSEVPESEWPKLPPIRNDPENIDRAIEKVLAEDGVLGCTKRNGRLIIYMKDTLHLSYDKVEQTVTKILNELEIKDYQIHHGSYQPLYKSGDGILNASGTLGGFAKKIPKHYNKNNNGNAASNLVALVSRHVVIDAETRGKISLYIGDVKVGEAIIHPIENLDIVPVDIFPEFIEDCQTEYMSHDGKTMNAHIPDAEFWETSMGKFVCLWGQNSNSKPAVGYIQEPMFKYGDNPTVCTILIREYNKQPVSEPGDSGSIVCALSRKRDKLYALAMIMGRYKHSVIGYDGPCYIALRLDEAFSMLEGQYSATFKLFNENDKK